MSTRTVLLVEEETQVREALATLLGSQGLVVQSAASGPEAIALYRQHAESIGVVLLDVGMSKQDGPQTLRELQRIELGVPCCFMTGGSQKYATAELTAMGAAWVFQKPFRVREVVQALKQLAPALTPDATGLRA